MLNKENFSQRNIINKFDENAYPASLSLCIGWFHLINKDTKKSTVPYLILLNLREKKDPMLVDNTATKTTTTMMAEKQEKHLVGSILFFWQSRANHQLYGLFKDVVKSSSDGNNAVVLSQDDADRKYSVSLCETEHLRNIVYSNGYTDKRFQDMAAKIISWNNMCGIISTVEINQRRAGSTTKKRKRDANEVVSIPRHVHQQIKDISIAPFKDKTKYCVKSVDCGNNNNVMNATSKGNTSLNSPQKTTFSPAQLNYLVEEYSQRYWQQTSNNASLETSTIPFQTFVNMVRWLKHQVKKEEEPYVMGKIASRLFEQMGWKLAKPEPLRDIQINVDSRSLDLDQVSLEVKCLESIEFSKEYYYATQGGGRGDHNTFDRIVHLFLNDIYKLIKNQVIILYVNRYSDTFCANNNHNISCYYCAGI
jgi:hypothetical protein